MVTDSARQPPNFALFQFGRFLIVGGVATALQYAILITLTVSGGVQPLLASTIGFVASSAANYTLNRRFTFRSHVDYLGRLQRFAIIATGGLGLNAIVMAAAIDLVGMNYIASQIVASGVVLLWNFHANRQWTFSTGLADSPKSTMENSPYTGSSHDREQSSDAARE
jgi:putative flippase GtrA